MLVSTGREVGMHKGLGERATKAAGVQSIWWGREKKPVKVSWSPVMRSLE